MKTLASVYVSQSDKCCPRWYELPCDDPNNAQIHIQGVWRMTFQNVLEMFLPTLNTLTNVSFNDHISTGWHLELVMNGTYSGGSNTFVKDLSQENVRVKHSFTKSASSFSIHVINIALLKCETYLSTSGRLSTQGKQNQSIMPVAWCIMYSCSSDRSHHLISKEEITWGYFTATMSASGRSGWMDGLIKRWSVTWEPTGRFLFCNYHLNQGCSNFFHWGIQKYIERAGPLTRDEVYRLTCSVLKLAESIKCR